jgi:bacterioferritin (cytochrome b1)
MEDGGVTHDSRLDRPHAVRVLNAALAREIVRVLR